jgi:hypothetical protein
MPCASVATATTRRPSCRATETSPGYTSGSASTASPGCVSVSTSAARADCAPGHTATRDGSSGPSIGASQRQPAMRSARLPPPGW